MHDHNILLIDNEVNVINALKRELRKESYQILTATNVQDALKIMAENPIQVVIADHRLEGASVIEFMANIKDSYPDTIRVILSGYTDIDSVTAAINKGHVYKYLLKPWDKRELKETVRQCLDLFELRKQNLSLTEKIRQQNQKLKYLNKNLELEVEKRMAEIFQKNKELNLSYEVMEHLPICVIGADDQKQIIFTNGLAKLYFERGRHSKLLHSTLNDHFSNELVLLVEEAIRTYLPQHMRYVYNSSLTFFVKCAPFTSELYSSGIIISFSELN